MQNNKPEVSADVLQALLNLRFAEKCEITHWTHLEELVTQTFRAGPDQELTFVLQPSIVLSRKVEVLGKLQTQVLAIPFTAVAYVEGLAEVVSNAGSEEIVVSREEQGLVVLREKQGV